MKLGDLRKLVRGKWTKRIVYILILIIIVVVSYVNGPAIKNQLRSWKLLPQPERLTELYFTDSQHLPSTYTPGQAQQVAFTVHNLEYQTTKYTFEVIEQSENGKQQKILASNGFTLAQDKHGNVKVPVTLVDLGSRVKIEVLLPSQKETIDYWVNKSGS